MRKVVGKGRKENMAALAADLIEAGHYAVLRYRLEHGWHVTVTPWA